MRSTSPRFSAIIAAAALALTAEWGIEAQGAGLFTPADQAVPRSGVLADETLRSRLVTIDIHQLGRSQMIAASTDQSRKASPRGDFRSVRERGATLLLNLFDDVTVEGIAEWTDRTFSGGYSVSGRLVGDPLGTMTLVVNGDRVVGSVITADGTYRIRSAGDGFHTVSQVELPPLKCGIEGPHPETADHRH